MPFVNCNKFNTSQALQDQAIADLAQELLTKQNALKDCSGNPLAGNVPTCAQMTTAIQNAIDALPADKFLKGLKSYNPATNTMTLLMSDGSTVDIDMTDLLADAVSGGAAPTGAAGGDLQGTYPNPTVNPAVVTNAVTNNLATQTAVAGVFNNCAGTPLTPRSRLLECSAKGTDIPYLVNGVIPANQLPSFVDDVLEFPALASFPATGEAGKIYIDASTNKTYRWNGTGYTEISASAGITVQDEGSVLTTAATSLKFVGAGLQATSSGGAVTVTVPTDTSRAAAVHGHAISDVSGLQAALDSKMPAGAESQIAAPVGSVYTFAGATVPTGWLKCNGALLSRTTYAALFAVIGTTYGAGDGSTTFALPDLRGEFVRGFDDGRGVDAGRVLGSNQGDAIRNIVGTIGAPKGVEWATASGAFELVSLSQTSAGHTAVDYPTTNNTWTLNVSRVVPTANENRPRNVSMHYIIKF